MRAGHWYTVRVKDGVTAATHRPDLLQRAEPVICAFDIETTKLPLRFPNAAYDQVTVLASTLSLDSHTYLKHSPCRSGVLLLSLQLPPPPAGVHDLLHDRPQGLSHCEP